MKLINQEWQEVALGKICDVRDGTHDSPKYVSEGYPLITSKNIIKGQINFSSVNLISETDYNQINKRSKVDKGDIIMPMIGTIGNPTIINSDKEFAIKNVALIKFSDKNILNKFVKLFLSSNLFYALVGKISRGATQKFISLKDIRSLKIPLPIKEGKPDLEKQKQIVSILEKIEKLKERRVRGNALLDEYLKSVFNEMFGNLIKNEKKWDIEKWQDVLEIINGKSQKKVIDIKGKYPVYGSGGIIGYANEYLSPENSIIIGRKGTINKPIKVLTKFWNVDTAFGLVPKKEKLNCDYLFGFCNLFNFETLNYSTTLPSLTKKNLLNIEISLPPLVLQEKFASIVKEVEKLKEKQKKSTEDIDELFDSLMQKAFAGELI